MGTPFKSGTAMFLQELQRKHQAGCLSDIKGRITICTYKEETSPTTTFKIQALESLDFSWDPNDAQWKATFEQAC
jgi:hypothetical protein